MKTSKRFLNYLKISYQKRVKVYSSDQVERWTHLKYDPDFYLPETIKKYSVYKMIKFWQHTNKVKIVGKRI